MSPDDKQRELLAEALEAAARAHHLFLELLVSELLPVFLLGVATVFACVGIDALAAQENN